MAKKKRAAPKKSSPGAAISRAIAAKPAVPAEGLLSTGSTMLNMALTGNPLGGFSKGKYFLLIGGSTSGKTFLSLTCMAEASINPAFKDYRFIYDDVEGGALMNIEEYFGKGVADRLEPPRVDEDGAPIYSETIEEMYFHLDDAAKDGRPFIYITDSLDALSSKSEGSKFDEYKAAARSPKKKKVSGDYGDGKAKVNSRYIRRVVSDLRDTGSIWIIISQERDNPAAGLFDPKKVFSGGRALKFYATAQIWFHASSALKRSVKSKDRKVGNLSRIHVAKNRYTGKDRTVTVPIYYSYGIDDLGSCINYLVDDGRWKRDAEKVIDTGDDLGGLQLKHHELVEYIEKEALELQVRQCVVELWKEIEAKCVIPRKKRYE